jgi:uroporphyrinogen decarboxylase
LSVCYNPDLAEEITLQPIRRFGFDAAILFSDILVIPDALGAGVRFLEGEGPQLDPLRDETGVARLDPGRLHGHLEPVYETLRRLRRSLPPAVTLIGFSGAPWTLAAYMVEGSGSKEYAAPRTMARRQRPLFKALIDLLTDAVIAYLDRQVQEGAEALQLFDSWAGVLPEGEFRAWCIEPAARIVAELNARHPGVPVICFPRGAGAGYLEFASSVRPQGLSLDTTVPMGWAAASLPGDVCLQGNLDPLAFFGTPEAMLEEAARILAATAGRAHVFNLGHGVLPPTDPAMVGRLVAYLQSSGGSLK